MKNDTNIEQFDDSSAKETTFLVYVLQASAFFIGITYFVALIVCYVKKGDAKGSWLESHYTWQIRTFWYSSLWFIVGLITLFYYIGILVLLVNAGWVIYRIAKGWLRLNDNKPMYC